MNNLKLMVFSRDRRWFGGVVNFLLVLEKYIEKQQDIGIIRFIIGKRFGSNSKIPGILCLMYDFFRLPLNLFANKIDVFLFNPSLNKSSFYRDLTLVSVVRLFKRKESRIIVLFHGWDVNFENAILRSKIKCFLFRHTFLKADEVMVLASSFKIYLEKNFLVKNVSLFSTMYSEENVSNFKKIENREPKNVRFLFLSRIEENKGVFELIKAFHIISNKYKNVYLDIAGDGYQSERLKALLLDLNNQSITYHGYLKGEQKRDLFKKSSAFVFPTSHGEGCPVSLIEAMASGLICVSTPVGAIPDMIQHGKNGFLLELPVNESDLINVLSYIVDNYDYCLDYANKAQKVAAENYKESIVSERIVNVIKGSFK